MKEFLEGRLLVPEDVMAMACTSDLWKDKISKRHYFGLTVHYIDSWALRPRRFALHLFPDQLPHTAENIRIQFFQLLHSFSGINAEEARMRITTDSASNTISAFGSSRCYCHRLQTIIEDTFLHPDNGVPEY